MGPALPKPKSPVACRSDGHRCAAFWHQTMKKTRKHSVREDRIHNEPIADAKGPEEQVMGWHGYLNDKMRFPFQAKCIAPKIVSPLRTGEAVDVFQMAPEDACSVEMLVMVRW